MPKSKVFIQLKSNTITRSEFQYLYDEKYFNLWLDSYDWKGITREQREYLMRKFWELGEVACFPIIKPNKNFLGVNSQAFSDGLSGFAPYSAMTFNMYNFPTQVLLINERGVPYIPNTAQRVNIDCVLMYAQHDREPVRSIIQTKIDRIVDVEMVINTNLVAHKMPVVYEVTPDSEKHAKDLQDNILSNIPSFFVNTGELDCLKAANCNAPYIIDKLQSYKQSLENELQAMMGIKGVSIEKQERLVTTEAEASNDITARHLHAVASCLKESCEQVKEVLGFDISCEPIKIDDGEKPMDQPQKGDSEDGN